MNPNSPQLEAVFHEALARTDAGERAAYLDSACAGDADFRRRVEALLAAHAERGEFLGGTDAATAKHERASNVSDIRIEGLIAGRYKLLELIGEGGMGAVYAAEQMHPVRRKVAVKIIKPGMDSKSVLARFEAERQALALMEHPNIARVLDAGTTEQGLPFFVMELVKGTPITKFCDERKLSPRERLELFIPVCQAIQHAHQKGVIHRDIKPSNVLVALYDERPVPKVIDFGVAKATGQALTEHTLHTGFGAILGTPEYMSPEQATFNQLDIDTRSDVYALGVLLYELLTGTTPVDKARLGQAAVLEVLRVVREDEPARPSLKLTTAEGRAGIAAVRGTEPDKLSKLLRGELDWIVMKALEKDRNRRYDTAVGLARDVQRYLADELVEARPPSAMYRLRKFSRKHASFLWTAVVITIVGIGWAAGLQRALQIQQQALTQALYERNRAEEMKETIQMNNELLTVLKDEAVANYEELEREKERAEANEKTAKAAAVEAGSVNYFFQYAMLLAASKEPGANVTLRQFVDTAEPIIETMLKDQPRNESRVRLLFGQMYAHWDAPAEAVRQLDRALSLPGLSGAEMMSLQMFAITAYARAGGSEKAVKTAQALLALSLKQHGADHPGTLQARVRLGSLYELTGKPEEAESHWREAVDGYRRRNSEGPAAKDDLPFVLERLAACLMAQGKPAEAEPMLRERLALLEKFGDRGSSAWIITTTTLADSLRRTKKFTAAELLLLDALKVFGLPDGKEPITDENLKRLVNLSIQLLAEIYDEMKQPDKAAAWRAKLPE